MKKIIISCLCLLLSGFILLCCFSKHTITMSGLIVEDGNESNVNIIITKKKIEPILHKMSGNISIKTINNKEIIQYNFLGPAFYAEDWCLISLIRFDKVKNIFDNGYMYFDKDLKNIVLIDDDRQVYAADDEFLATINSVISNASAG